MGSEVGFVKEIVNTWPEKYNYDVSQLHNITMLLTEGSIQPCPRLMPTALSVLQTDNEHDLKFHAAGTWLIYDNFDY